MLVYELLGVFKKKELDFILFCIPYVYWNYSGVIQTQTSFPLYDFVVSKLTEVGYTGL